MKIKRINSSLNQIQQINTQQNSNINTLNTTINVLNNKNNQLSSIINLLSSNIENKANITSIPANDSFALSGLSQRSYNSLTDKPNLDSFITVNDNISGIANEANKLTTARKIQLSGAISGFALFDGSNNIIIKNTLDNITIDADNIYGLTISWDNILNKPNIPLSCDFTDQYKSKLDNIQNGAQVNKIELIKVNNQNLVISNKTINIDLSNKANLSDIPINSDFSLSGLSQKSYNSLTDKPNLNIYIVKESSKNLSTNDFSNQYKTKLDNIQSNAQTNKIEIIKVNNQDLTINNKSINITNDKFALSGLYQRSYNSLTNKPTIPTTLASLSQKSYNSLTDKPTIPTNNSFTLAGLSQKSYNSLTDKPTIPTNNSFALSGLSQKSYNSLTNKPTIPTTLASLSQKSYNSLTDKPDLTNYVVKENGKGLSTNNFSNQYKSKLDNIQSSAQVNKIESIKVNNNTLSIDNKSVNITNNNFSLSGLYQRSYNSLTDKPTIIDYSTDITNIYSDITNISSAIGSNYTSSNTVKSAILSNSNKINQLSSITSSFTLSNSTLSSKLNIKVNQIETTYTNIETITTYNFPIKNNAIFKHTLVANEGILIPFYNYPTNKCISFDIWFIMPESVVSFTISTAKPTYWCLNNNFNNSNSIPAFSQSNTLYAVNFKWDGTNVLANLLYTKTL